MDGSNQVEGSLCAEDVDAVVIGAGIAGLYAVYRLSRLGLSVRVLEKGSGIGGTWYWNRYPGARCDIESMEYSYQFSEALQQEWVWSERYAAQPEVLEYLNHVADRFDLRRYISFNTEVTSAVFDEAANHWVVRCEDGTRVSGRFCIMATGAVSSPRIPDFRGVEDFQGETYHTAEWPHHRVDFAGKRVGVIGTGTSGIQCTPIIARQAAHLFVFQRTANYYVPIQNHPMDAAVQARIKADYAGFRKRNSGMPYGYAAGDPLHKGSAMDRTPGERDKEYEWRWEQGGFYFLAAFEDLLRNEGSNRTAADFIRRKIRTLVHDPATAEKLCPDLAFGCKRLSMGTGYYETFNRDNVTLVDVREAPIRELTRNGLKTGDREYALDCIVFATGFHDMVGALRGIDIRGAAGRKLSDKWAASENPTVYLGLSISGFPNLFTVTGPGSPSITCNMVAGIEQNVDWIAECIDFMDRRNLVRIEADPEAERAWARRVNELAAGTLYHACNSRYVGPHNPDKPRYFMPYLGYPDYVRKCAEIAANGYRGFTLSRHADSKPPIYLQQKVGT